MLKMKVIINQIPKNDKYMETDFFDQLNFSPDAKNLEEIHTEIDTDLAEFISCKAKIKKIFHFVTSTIILSTGMKNSVFYGSGIQRFYNQELDKYRRKFIELEEDKHRWLFLVSFFKPPL